MENIIFLTDVLSDMKRLDSLKNPIPFSIKIRTFNLQNKTGGNIKFYSSAVLLNPPRQKGAKRLAMNIDFKNPNHFANRTRNIKLPDGQIKKINILFIQEYNGKKVVY
ncbi:hypothetical protein [Riemerella anatipestifer]|uniref:hypothetical protein n=1 Tax=Riemerella anatipestifer TaxID=34085 RepID=UPI00129D7D9C|nr:hypothetical protein [Riemerella anatipestifer]MBT0551972.1 hypothetical protein [Riemerella anatipestifer]MBT0554158.1 hypothetical protein [Riemerella anatipestifer]MCE3024759.1 hypothetical protein [Riemerella anatipestifer]MCU7560364.1 hypothetical protein [Riemerella anatipestifer]MDY3449635.1 hypothetical protein [Riemerella anatipestifer]